MCKQCSGTVSVLAVALMPEFDIRWRRQTCLKQHNAKEDLFKPLPDINMSSLSSPVLFQCKCMCSKPKQRNHDAEKQSFLFVELLFSFVFSPHSALSMHRKKSSFGISS